MLAFFQGNSRLVQVIQSKLGFERVDGDGASKKSTVVPNHHGGRSSDGSREIDSPIVDRRRCRGSSILWRRPMMAEIDEGKGQMARYGERLSSRKTLELTGRTDRGQNTAALASSWCPLPSLTSHVLRRKVEGGRRSLSLQIRRTACAC